MEEILRSPTKESWLLQRMGLDDDQINNKEAKDTPTCTGGVKGAGVATGQSEQRRHATSGSNPTSRGMSMGNANPRTIFPPEDGTAFDRIPMGFPLHPCLPPFGMGLGYLMT